MMPFQPNSKKETGRLRIRSLAAVVVGRGDYSPLLPFTMAFEATVLKLAKVC